MSGTDYINDAGTLQLVRSHFGLSALKFRYVIRLTVRNTTGVEMQRSLLAFAVPQQRAEATREESLKKWEKAEE